MQAGEVIEALRETLDITLTRGWVYRDVAFREEMKHLIEIKTPNSLAGGSAEEVVEAYLRQAEKALAFTRETLLEKKKSVPEKIAVGILIKETTGLNHKDIATLLNTGHPVRSARLINEALKTKDLDSPVMRCYEQIIQVGRRA